MRRLASIYLRWLDTRPLLTKVATSAVVLSLADLNCQNIQGYKEFDFWRMKNFTLLAVFYTGPILHNWYKFLQFGPIIRDFRVAGKIAVDIAFMAPLMTSTIMCILSALQCDLDPEKSWEKSKRRLREDWLNTLMNGIPFWICTNIIILNFVPYHVRVLAQNVGSFIWNTYLAWVCTRKELNSSPVDLSRVKETTDDQP